MKEVKYVEYIEYVEYVKEVRCRSCRWFRRRSVAGAVLQTVLWLIHRFTK